MLQQLPASRNGSALQQRATSLLVEAHRIAHPAAVPTVCIQGSFALVSMNLRNRFNRDHLHQAFLPVTRMETID